MLEMFKTNSCTEKQFVYNPDKTLQEQNVSETARTIIAILFRDYWATENKKQKILDKQNFDRKKLQEEKYNPDNLFKNPQKEITNSNIISEMSMVEYKEDSIFTKIKKFIKKLFIGKSI